MTMPFGFTVRKVEPGEHRTERWAVGLPHQCDAWDIAGEMANYGTPHDGVPHAEAVAELERFLTEGAAALEALRAQRELKPDWD